MPKILLLLSLCFLISCAKTGGGGDSPTPTPTPTPTTTSNLTTENRNVFFGVLSPAQSKSKVITLKNTGTKATNALSLSIPTNANFTIDQDNCSGHTLAVSASCTLRVNFTQTTEAAYNGNFSVVGANNSLNIRMGAVIKDIPEMLEGSNPSYLLSVLTADQNSDGSWTNGSLSFDLGTTLYVAQSLAKAKSVLGFNYDVYITVDKTIDYLETTTAGGGGQRAIDWVADRNTVMPEWTRVLPAGGMKLKEASPALISVADNLHELKNGSSSPAISYFSAFADSRRVSSSVANATAQYAYIWDRNRWNTFYGSGFVTSTYGEIVESAYKDTYLLLQSYLRQGNQTAFNEVANLIYKHFLFNSTDLTSTFGLTLRYSTVEFVHSSFTNANLDMTLSDYYNSCRQLGWGILVLSLVHDKATNLDPLDKADMYNTNINYFWTIMKNDYYSNLASMDDIERTRCIPMMARAVSAIPNRNQVLPNEATNIYQALFALISDDLAMTNIQDFSLEGAEFLRALVDGVSYQP